MNHSPTGALGAVSLEKATAKAQTRPTVWLPQGLLKHPYCELLFAALERRGVKREDATGFWVLSKIRPAEGAVFHIHWADHYVISGNRPRTLLKIALFTMELLLLKARGVRIVWTVHNLKNHENAMPWLDRLGSTVIARLADSLILHCEAAKSAAMARFGVREDRCHVIAHGHFIDRYPTGPSRAEARAELGLGPDEHVFLVFGLIRPYKGLDRLLEVFERTKKPGQRLLIVGALYGSMDQSWPERTQRKYPWAELVVGRVDDGRLPLYFRAADVALFPYRDILTSGAMILAMGFGLPCVGPRAGCVPEALAASANILFDPDSDASLAEAIETIDGMHASWAEMGATNRANAEALSWDRIAELTLDAYAGKAKRS